MILQIGNFDNPSWDGSVPDERHIANSLESIGFAVYRKQRENQEFPDKEFELVLVSQWNGYGEHFCKRLKEKYNCPIVYWAFDYQFASGESWHFEMAKEADIFLSPELKHREFYQSLEANFHYFPNHGAPDFLDVEEQDKIYDIIFTGSCPPNDCFRKELLKEIDKKYDLHIFSTTPWEGFKNVHPAVHDRDLPKLIGSAKINISVDTFEDSGTWSDRNSQIMACGGFILFKYVPQSELFFKDGVVYFSTIPECMKQIKRYLKDGSPRELIAANGYMIAHNGLMVSDIAEQLITVVENAIKRV